MMNEKEKQLLKALCKFEEKEVDARLTEFATPRVLGLLFLNRMQGIAYDTLKKSNLLGRVNREFRNSLGSAYEQNIEKNRSFLKCVSMLSQALQYCNFPIAMLKGAYLCAHYPKGYRTSNDIDLLVLPQDVTKVGNLLEAAGFEQGHVRNGNFERADRREIIESKMMRGETVPYIKEVNLPFMRFLEVDVNFSLDYKNGQTDMLSNMLSRTCVKDEQGIFVPTLEQSDFFLHLCAHLYKEATTLPWIEMKRDMTLYKYCDIYFLASQMSEGDRMDLFARAKALGMEKTCAYAILETMDLFDMEMEQWKAVAEDILRDSPEFLLQVVSPKEKKVYRYRTLKATDRFFMNDRILDLQEVLTNEKA